ncbi:unnamed protein product, partial [Didymodactylos carnosus]
MSSKTSDEGEVSPNEKQNEASGTDHHHDQIVANPNSSHEKDTGHGDDESVIESEQHTHDNPNEANHKVEQFITDGDQVTHNTEETQASVDHQQIVSSQPTTTSTSDQHEDVSTTTTTTTTDYQNLPVVDLNAPVSVDEEKTKDENETLNEIEKSSTELVQDTQEKVEERTDDIK